MINATLGRSRPAANSTPAKMGLAAAPARPMPMMKPVPVARNVAGNAAENIAYRPATAPLVKKLAIAAAMLRLLSVGALCPNQATKTTDPAIMVAVIERMGRRNVNSPATTAPAIPPTFAHTSTPPADAGW